MTIPMIDCHQHLIYSEKWKYSWTDEIPALAGKEFNYQNYLELIKDKGEIRSIFMEACPDDPYWLEESEFVASLADAEDSIIDGLILTCRPETEENFGTYLDSIQHPKLVGLRRILHVEPDEMSQSTLFIDNIRQLADRNLTYDLCFLARQLPLAVELAEICPDVQFVLDHCGVPDIADGGLDPWRENIRELASHEHVACKISGVISPFLKGFCIKIS